MKKKIKARTVYNIAIVLFIVSVFTYFCFSQNGLLDLSKNAKQFSKGWLFVALLSHCINLTIDVFLIYFFTYNGEKTYNIKNAARASLVGQFFNSVTPAASGGQPMQAYIMSKQGISAGLAGSALIQKFLVYQNVLVCYSAVSILLRFNYFNSLDKHIWFWATVGFIIQSLAIIILLFFSFNEKVTMHFISSIFSMLGRLRIIKKPESKIDNLKHQLEAFHEGNRKLYKNKRLLFITYLLTFLQMTAVFIIPYFIYRSFHFSGVPPIDIICAQAFVTMSTSFFPIPGASGATEVTSMIFMNNFFTETTIKPAVVIIRLISYYLTILISVPAVYLIKSSKKQL